MVIGFQEIRSPQTEMFGKKLVFKNAMIFYNCRTFQSLSEVHVHLVISFSP